MGNEDALVALFSTAAGPRFRPAGSPVLVALVGLVYLGLNLLPVVFSAPPRLLTQPWADSNFPGPPPAIGSHFQADFISVFGSSGPPPPLR